MNIKMVQVVIFDEMHSTGKLLIFIFLGLFKLLCSKSKKISALSFKFRTLNFKFLTSNVEARTSNFGPYTLTFEFWIANLELWSLSFEFWNLGPRTLNFVLWFINFPLWCSVQIIKFRGLKCEAFDVNSPLLFRFSNQTHMNPLTLHP